MNAWRTLLHRVAVWYAARLDRASIRQPVVNRRSALLLFLSTLLLGARTRTALANSDSRLSRKKTPASRFAAIYTGNLAFQDPAGGTNAPPNYESVHLMADGRIASIGWIGIHAPEFSNAIFAFDPATNTVDVLAPWEQYISTKDLRPKVPPVRGAGYNKHCSTHDNHPSAYFADTNSLVWFGHCVFDVASRRYLKGNRPPHTEGWETYATGHNGMATTYNPAYAQCPDLNVVAFYGASYGGYGTSATSLVVWKRTDSARAPWHAIVTDLAAKGIPGIARARNNAACLGTKMYVGGGQGGRRGTRVVDSVFTVPDHGYREGFEFSLFPDAGQAGMPRGMTYGQAYYVSDVTPDTFRISATRGGRPLSVGDLTPLSGAIPNYRMWAIDLRDLSVELVSDGFGLGVMDSYPQLMADIRRNRLLLVGKQVSVYDPASRMWSPVEVERWPAGGFKSVVGAHVAARDRIFFRGTPAAGDIGRVPWQWNSIAFTNSRSI
jgi:hypothetical protein